ncbi:hypothetical protein Btru_054231, partial [Bulinus truncatus]
PCPINWRFDNFTRTCFGLQKDKTDWLNARRRCQSAFKGADLATIKSSYVNTFLEEISQHSSDHFWIGLNKINKGGIFSWLDEKVEILYSKWGNLQPRFIYECGSFYAGIWFTSNCTHKMNYLCQFQWEDESDHYILLRTISSLEDFTIDLMSNDVLLEGLLKNITISNTIDDLNAEVLYDITSLDFLSGVVKQNFRKNSIDVTMNGASIDRRPWRVLGFTPFNNFYTSSILKGLRGVILRVAAQS